MRTFTGPPQVRQPVRTWEWSAEVSVVMVPVAGRPGA